MKLSRNNIIVKDIKGNRVILANTYTRSVIELTEKAYLSLNNSTKDTELTAENYRQLEKMGFIVPEDLNEDKFLEYLFLRQKIHDKALVTYIMYSTSCNFSCKYCYEKGHNKIETMTEKTVKNLIDWYAYNFNSDAIPECHIILFGGEPLLFVDKFLYLLHTVKDLADKKNIKITTKIVTNGYLLSEQIINKLLAYNLVEVQITLDGLAPIHDKQRPLNNGKGTFDAIFGNLLKFSRLYKQIRFLCRMSFDHFNYSHVPELLNYIHNNDQDHYIKPYFAHITQTFSQKNSPDSFCSQNVFSDDSDLAKCYSFLWKEAYKLGYNIPSFFTLGPCMFFSSHGFVIAPNGEIYKCLDMVGVPKQIVGYVSKPIHYKDLYYNIVLDEQVKFCLNTDCPYVPICGNGCVLESWLKYNKYNKICCKRQFLDTLHKNLLSIKYKIQD